MCEPLKNGGKIPKLAGNGAVDKPIEDTAKITKFDKWQNIFIIGVKSIEIAITSLKL